MTSRARLQFRATATVVCVAAVAGLAACTSTGPAPAPSASWVDPPWVAEQAAQREEYQAGLQSCLDGKGWQVTVDLDGGIEEGFTDQNEFARLTTDIKACRVSMGYSADGVPATVDELKVFYSQLLDTRACLVAHGVAMGPPPSEDAWIDAQQPGTDAQSGDADWHPYNDPALEALSMDQQNALEALCPQPWGTK